MSSSYQYFSITIPHVVGFFNRKPLGTDGSVFMYKLEALSAMQPTVSKYRKGFRVAFTTE